MVARGGPAPCGRGARTHRPRRDDGDPGLGQPFRFPFVSVESVLPLGGDRVLVANDNNFPFDAGRQPGKADDTELIQVDVPGLRRR